MPEPKLQNFANHTMFDPAFHFWIAPIALINVIVQSVNLYKFPSLQMGWILVLSLTALGAVFKMRLYSLRVQDRLIRLEERLRLYKLLPESARSRIDQLTPGQYVGLRFASDAELPALFEKTVSGNLKPKEIKQSVATWRPDYFRV